MEYTQFRIKEIASQLGYTDPFHFSRVFTNIMGKSPKEFRKKRIDNFKSTPFSIFYFLLFYFKILRGSSQKEFRLPSNLYRCK
ncbi:MAG: AraC family transcriptional regulator [Saprospiraceae bacterium]|nr:AraC family transcriptional regulator [Saprospiraceae bacterium]